ncbi:uncharacterized protein LOC123702538 [Colias croceus]|uniref:uncharacterized protein LOC123702538 n=1 Tax=Colias crocea TaxID=72248 RepID=UPI001E27B3CC|nr:uncharacterized protein LOC123702538 [Colias croceus]
MPGLASIITQREPLKCIQRKEAEPSTSKGLESTITQREPLKCIQRKETEPSTSKETVTSHAQLSQDLTPLLPVSADKIMPANVEVKENIGRSYYCVVICTIFWIKNVPHTKFFTNNSH